MDEINAEFLNETPDLTDGELTVLQGTDFAVAKNGERYETFERIGSHDSWDGVKESLAPRITV